MRYESPSSVTLSPTTCGSPRNAERQSTSEMTTVARCAGARIDCREKAAEFRLHPERRKEVARHVHAREPARLAAAGQRFGVVRVRTGTRKRAILRAQIVEVRQRQRERGRRSVRRRSQTRRSPCGYGSGASTTARKMLKTVAFAPIASASVAITIPVKSGVFRNERKAKTRSRNVMAVNSRSAVRMRSAYAPKAKTRAASGPCTASSSRTASLKSRRIELPYSRRNSGGQACWSRLKSAVSASPTQVRARAPGAGGARARPLPDRRDARPPLRQSCGRAG